MLFIYLGCNFKTMELLKRAIITEWQKVSQCFIDSSFTEWCCGLECVAKNDCGHVEHFNPARITAFIKDYCYIKLLMGD